MTAAKLKPAAMPRAQSHLLLGGNSTLETLGGVITLEARDGAARVDMGTPRFDWNEIPLADGHAGARGAGKS